MITKKDLAKLKSRNLNSGNFHTIYTAKLNADGNERIIANNSMCFSKLFSAFIDYPDEIIIKSSYNIRLITPAHIDNSNHVCFFKRKDIEKYLNILKNHFSFTYKLVVDEDYGYSLIVNNLKGTPLCHKIFLTSVRYLYEFPFSGVLYSTLQFFKNHPETEKEQLFQILYINSILFYDFNSMLSGHSLFSNLHNTMTKHLKRIPKKFSKYELMSCVSEGCRINDYFSEAKNVIVKHTDAEIEQEYSIAFAKTRDRKLNLYQNIIDTSIQDVIQKFNNMFYGTINR